MSINLPNWYVRQYATNIQLLLQQTDSRLNGAVRTGSHVGKSASPVDQVGAVSMQPVVGRFQPMGRVDAVLDRRWVFPFAFDLPQLIDSFDQLQILTDPKSSYVQNAVAAARRQMDDLIIDAFFADAKTGEEGATTTSFPAGNIVSVDFSATGEVGLTVAKLREAKRILMANEVDLKTDQIYCAVTARQHDNLLAETQVISTDFNEKPVLVEGMVTRFLGINLIHTERLDLVSSDNRQIPVWAKSGMYLGTWQDINTSISQRNDIQSEPWQAYLKMMMGATRLEEKKVVQILCDE